MECQVFVNSQNHSSDIGLNAIGVTLCEHFIYEVSPKHPQILSLRISMTKYKHHSCPSY